MCSCDPGTYISEGPPNTRIAELHSGCCFGDFCPACESPSISKILYEQKMSLKHIKACRLPVLESLSRRWFKQDRPKAVSFMDGDLLVKLLGRNTS